MASLMERAHQAARERVEAVGANPEWLMSGFDVTSDEVRQAGAEYAHTAAEYVGSRDLLTIFSGLWMSGFITALHYERLRRDEVSCVQCGERASSLSGRVVVEDGSTVHACSAECAAEFLKDRAA